jgi:hypothetical protein
MRKYGRPNLTSERSAGWVVPRVYRGVSTFPAEICQLDPAAGADHAVPGDGAVVRELAQGAADQAVATRPGGMAITVA